MLASMPYMDPMGWDVVSNRPKSGEASQWLPLSRTETASRCLEVKVSDFSEKPVEKGTATAEGGLVGDNQRGSAIADPQETMEHIPWII